jgi:hypothetical protein
METRLLIADSKQSGMQTARNAAQYFVFPHLFLTFLHWHSASFEKVIMITKYLPLIAAFDVSMTNLVLGGCVLASACFFVIAKVCGDIAFFTPEKTPEPKPAPVDD